MKYLKINGKNELNGEVDIRGAKNIIVALLPATILTNETIHFSNVPLISDVLKLVDILKSIGANVEIVKNDILVNTSNVKTSDLLSDDIEKIRASSYFMGAMLSRFKEVNIKYPGGCNLGKRPIDYHLAAFNEMGYDVESIDSIYITKKYNVKRAEVDAKNSVGTTINILFASYKSEQSITIKNYASEFEVLEIVKFLKQIGMNINVGKDKLVIKTKVSNIKKTNFKIAFDRMEAMSYAYIGFLLGKVRIKGINVLKMTKPLELINEMGGKIVIDSFDSIIVEKRNFIGGKFVKTGYYPNFPTDLQQPLTTALLHCNNGGKIRDLIYPNRTSHIEGLKKMGADIRIKNDEIIIEKSELKGTEVEGKDLRGTMALVIAALSAEGESHVYGFEHLERGYDDVVNKLKSLGANIELL